MRPRDRQIINDLQRFRCMSRDDIIDLHFKNLKNPVSSANNVLKRLRRDGHVEVNTQVQPYLYFLNPSSIKKDSQKAPHFLAIVQFYKQLLKYDMPKQFIVEPKYGKEYMEPDAFMIWKGAPFFVEIQCSHYSQKVMSAKLQRYEKYLHSDLVQKESWQPKNKKVFPYIWIVTDIQYNLHHKRLRIFQTRDVTEFMLLVA